MRLLNTRLIVVRAVLAVAVPASSGAQTLSAFSKQKAERLLKEQLPCLGCHRLNGDGGSIGPDLTTVRERRSAAYISAMITDPQRVVPGSAMPRVLMPDEINSKAIQTSDQMLARLSQL